MEQEKESKMKAKKIILLVLKYLFLVIAIFLFISPILFELMTAFKFKGEIYNMDKIFIFKPTLENWITAIKSDQLLLYLKNSFVFTISSTLIAMVFASITGYALSKLKMRKGARKNLSFWFLSMRMMPPIAVVIPIFILFQKLGIMYEPIGLILVYVAFNLPLAVWLMEGFFHDVPNELIEASQMDGASPIKSFLTIALPLSTPGLISTMILTYIFIWNEFLFATILTTESIRTLPVWASFVIKSHFQVDYGLLAVASITMIIPVVIFSVLIQKYLVRGLTLGAIKG